MYVFFTGRCPEELPRRAERSQVGHGVVDRLRIWSRAVCPVKRRTVAVGCAPHTRRSARRGRFRLHCNPALQHCNPRREVDLRFLRNFQIKNVGTTRAVILYDGGARLAPSPSQNRRRRQKKPTVSPRCFPSPSSLCGRCLFLRRAFGFGRFCLRESALDALTAPRAALRSPRCESAARTRRGSSSCARACRAVASRESAAEPWRGSIAQRATAHSKRERVTPLPKSRSRASRAMSLAGNPGAIVENHVHDSSTVANTFNKNGTFTTRVNPVTTDRTAV